MAAKGKGGGRKGRGGGGGGGGGLSTYSRESLVDLHKSLFRQRRNSTGAQRENINRRMNDVENQLFYIDTGRNRTTGTY